MKFVGTGERSRPDGCDCSQPKKDKARQSALPDLSEKF